MSAQEFDDVAALVNQWRADTLPARRPAALLPPDLRAYYHVGRALDDGRVTDGMGDQIAAELEAWLETLP
jgi:hypothetical protein